MKLKHTALWSGVVAAALLLTACGKSNSGSGSMSSSGMSSSTASTAQNGAWKTGLGVLTETTDDHRTGKINLVAAAGASSWWRQRCCWMATVKFPA